MVYNHILRASCVYISFILLCIVTSLLSLFVCLFSSSKPSSSINMYTVNRKKRGSTLDIIKGAGSYVAGMAVAIPILDVSGRRHTNFECVL